MDVVTFQDIRRELKEMTRKFSQTRVATELGISQPLLNQIIRGVRGDRVMNGRVLKAMGFDQEPRYLRKKQWRIKN